MKETVQTIQKWHEESFPDATLPGQLTKFQEEVDEFKEATEETRLEELADMVIVSAGVARFDSQFGAELRQQCYLLAADYRYDMTELWEAIDAKMEKNRARVWKKTTEGAYHHINKED